MQYTKSLTELKRSDLLLAGGKGANLGALLQAGLPVPPGFCITTAGYREFVAHNHLTGDLRQILNTTQADDPAALERASQQIRAHFSNGQIPPALADEIRQSYLDLSSQPLAVAVRSSATAEDLPDLSFAGQQDTYLNVLGAEVLLDAVVRCWASLWTGRAIAYRARNGIPHAEVSLAVVVQQMAPSEAAGVLFTANPLTGKRSETVIDATLGLGEALVSGQVQPDHYEVDTASGRILSKTLGAKALVIQGKPGGGTVTSTADASTRQALPDEQILALARLGQQAAAGFGGPQDMEWAWGDGQMYVVQSRPVTSLYPLPANVSAEPLEVLLSFGVWQGMLDPYTPAGFDVFDQLVTDLGGSFGAKVEAGQQRVLLNAGERIFLNVTGLLGNSFGRQFLSIFVAAIDPASGSILASVMEDERFAPTGGVSLRTRLRLLRALRPVALNVAFNILFPQRGRERLQKTIDDSYTQLQERYAAVHTLPELAAAIEDPPTNQVAKLMPILVAAVAAGQGAPLQILARLAAHLPRGPELVMELTRGLPYNVTTEMDLALWQAAQAIRSDAADSAHFGQEEVSTLVNAYHTGSLPATTQAAIARFLARYGRRGVGEIDLGRPRWDEDPTPLFQVLKSYLQINENQSPEIQFKRGAAIARQAEEQLVAAFRASPGGWLKARLARFLARRVRELGGLRESPKFAIIQRLGIFRQALLAAGRELVEQGQLDRPDDIFFLHSAELKVFKNDHEPDWKALIAERRTTYQRELRRKRVPRLMLSDGSAFYDAPLSSSDGANTLSGSPVSPGIVEGVVHVVFDPHGAQLAPGEILVCPATDPAWTPLFLAAGGLVMEVGGMMTHGSVVAREYGIPAVVGVPRATERLRTGQRVRVDGATGKITL
ncbi:MAG: PEP/pyruvate-binding domain-containing protein [Chloroflexota bacterium]